MRKPIERSIEIFQLTVDPTVGWKNFFILYLTLSEILNEGVDIVKVNQVIMLRPTESPIVFIQQMLHACM